MSSPIVSGFSFSLMKIGRNVIDEKTELHMLQGLQNKFLHFD